MCFKSCRMCSTVCQMWLIIMEGCQRHGMLSKVAESDSKVTKYVIESRQGLSNVLFGPFMGGHFRSNFDTSNVVEDDTEGDRRSSNVTQCLKASPPQSLFWSILSKVNTLHAPSMSLAHFRRFHPRILSTTFGAVGQSLYFSSKIQLLSSQQSHCTIPHI